MIDNFKPDLAFFDPRLDSKEWPNRLPGDIKPSYKWSHWLQFAHDPTTVKEFKQALSQVNFYMEQHHTQYGYILRDQELVAIRKLDITSNLEVSAPIPWSAQGKLQLSHS